jgi:hypothetical protein
MIDYQEVSEGAQPFGAGDLTGGDRVYGLTFAAAAQPSFQARSSRPCVDC